MDASIKRTALWVIVVAIAHAAITMAILFVSGGLVMSAFDGKRAPGNVEAIGLWTVQILMAPLSLIHQELIRTGWNPLALDNLLFYANSLLWAILIVWLIRRRRRAV